MVKNALKSMDRYVCRISFLLLLVLAVGCFLISPSENEFWVIILEFLGGFHPLILHLPIGLWFGVLCLMGAYFFLKEPVLFQVIRWGVILTLYTGFAAFGAGFMLYLAGSYSSDVLKPHMYGSLAFLVGVGAQVWVLRGGNLGKLACVVAFITSALLVYAGHIGGVITHGEPMDKAPWVVLQKRKQAQAAPSSQSVAGEEKVFEDLVYPILDSKCINCHGVERAKGKLRMDSVAALIKGGAQGTSLVAGDIKASLMIKRIHLPLTDKEHMPPKDKEQLTQEEIAFLEWWVADGAKEDQLVRDAKFPAQLKTFVDGLTGESPEAIARKEELKNRENVMHIYDAVKSEFPGVLTQSIQGQSIFELSSASIYDINEEKLRSKLGPLMEQVVRLDWVNRAVEPEWHELFKKPRNLEVLNLSLSKISNEQLISLLQCHGKLVKLNLTGTAIDNQVIETLFDYLKTRQLQTLILTDTKISKERIKHIQEAYPELDLIF